MAKATKVIDGDTFETVSGRRVRLSNVNAPEVGKPGADEATAKLRELIEGKMFVLTLLAQIMGR